MASAINDWKDLIAENIYDILIELHFPHEMALRMKSNLIKMKKIIKLLTKILISIQMKCQTDYYPLFQVPILIY